MNQQILEKVYDVVDEMKNSDAYKRLMELKQLMEQSPEVQAKAALFQKQYERYEEVKRYGKFHPDLKTTQKVFQEAKIALYEDLFVSEYKQLEQTIQKELDTISKTIATTISHKIKHPNEVGMLKRH